MSGTTASMGRFLSAIAVSALLAACSIFGGGDDPTSASGGGGGDTDAGADVRKVVNGSSDYAFTINAVTKAVPVIPGKTGTVTLSVVRGAQLTEPIVVTVDGLRAGVTAMPLTITGDSGDLVIAAAPGTTQGDAMGTVTATAMSRDVGPVTTTTPLTALVRGEPGTLDLRWGTGGKVTSVLGAQFVTPMLDLFVAADDSVYVLGYCNDFGVPHVCCAHLTADGSIDQGYGTLGVGVLPVTDANGSTLQADGRVVVVGGRQVAFGFVGRFDAAGKPDTSFGNGGTGVNTVDFAFGNGVWAVVRQEKVKNLIGALDTSPASLASFGPNGGHLSNYGSFGFPTLGTGQILALSSRHDGSAVDGNVDAIWFNGNSVYFEEFGANDGMPLTSTLNLLTVAGARRPNGGNPGSATLADGSIVVPITGTAGVSVVKFTARGAGAVGFGIGGVANAIAGYGDGDGIGAQADGKLLVAFAGGGSATLVRLDATGVPDPTFGSNGVAHTQLGASTIGHKVAVQKSGRIIITAQSASANLAALWP